MSSYSELTFSGSGENGPFSGDLNLNPFPVNAHFLLSVLLVSLPPRAPTHTPSFSPPADNPMGHSGRTEAVWRCSERGLLQVSGRHHSVITAIIENY